MASNTGQTLIALLTGAAIGAGLGILYAPDKGSKTRDKLSKEAKKAQKKLNKQIQETSHTLSEKAQQAKYSLEQKLNDTLVAMEDKLEALRRQNAKLQIDSKVDKAKATAKKVTA